MDIRDAFRLNLEVSEMVCMGYIEDLQDEQLMLRPHPDCNHINWQLGHLIVSEHEMLSKVAPGKAAPLPEGFAEKYSRDTAKSDNPADFAKKEELLAAYRQQRQAALAALAEAQDADFDKPSGLDYAPTVGAVFNMLGSHWLMHAGQWVIVRRQLGLKAKF